MQRYTIRLKRIEFVIKFVIIISHHCGLSVILDK